MPLERQVFVPFEVLQLDVAERPFLDALQAPKHDVGRAPDAGEAQDREDEDVGEELSAIYVVLEWWWWVDRGEVRALRCAERWVRALVFRELVNY